MEGQDRIPVRTIQVTEPISRFQQLMPAIALLVDATMGLAFGAYLVFFLAEGKTAIVVAGIALMLIMPVGGLFTYYLLTYAFQRSQRPVMLYKDGVEFHPFTFERLLRHPSYVRVSQLKEVTVDTMVAPRDPSAPTAKPQMSFRTSRGWVYSTGARSREEVDRALEFICREWGVPVVDRLRSNVNGKVITAPDRASSAPPRARKVPVVGATAVTAPPAAPVLSFCPSCGGGVVSGSRFCPACGHQFGPSVRGQYDGVGGKKPRTAFLLGLLPGLLGLMGVGHMYVGRKVLGIVLMFVGVVLAMLALASMVILLDPAYGMSGAGAVVTAALFNIPFLGLLIWSSLDARDRARRSAAR